MILYNRPEDEGGPNAEASEDVLSQVEVVQAALAGEAIETGRVEVRGNTRAELDELCLQKPDLVFNLVESVNDNPTLFPAMAAVLELLGIPFTGSGSLALAASTNKLLAKAAFRGAGLPTPDWRVFDGSPGFSAGGFAPPWIVKPAFEDASIGIDDCSLFDDERLMLAALPELWTTHSKRPLLVEKYIDGREFTIPLLQGRAGLETLPMVETDFSAFPPAKPRIMGYRAKWHPGTFEYQNTPLVCVGDSESRLARALNPLAERACEAIGVSGYARVDFRVSGDGVAWILEVNANPCITQGSAFMTAAAAAGLSASGAVMRIVEAAGKSFA